MSDKSWAARAGKKHRIEHRQRYIKQQHVDALMETLKSVCHNPSPDHLALGKMVIWMVEVDMGRPLTDFKRCPVCNGNNADMPCAYPGEQKPGCLRHQHDTEVV